MTSLMMKVSRSKKEPKAMDPKFLISRGKLLRIGLSGYPSSKYQIATADETIYFSQPEMNINTLDYRSVTK